LIMNAAPLAAADDEDGDDDDDDDGDDDDDDDGDDDVENIHSGVTSGQEQKGRVARWTESNKKEEIISTKPVFTW
jgi:hypothetical protein